MPHSSLGTAVLVLLDAANNNPTATPQEFRDVLSADDRAALDSVCEWAAGRAQHDVHEQKQASGEVGEHQHGYHTVGEQAPRHDAREREAREREAREREAGDLRGLCSLILGTSHSSVRSVGFRDESRHLLLSYLLLHSPVASIITDALSSLLSSAWGTSQGDAVVACLCYCLRSEGVRAGASVSLHEHMKTATALCGVSRVLSSIHATASSLGTGRGRASTGLEELLGCFLSLCDVCRPCSASHFEIVVAVLREILAATCAVCDHLSACSVGHCAPFHFKECCDRPREYIANHCTGDLQETERAIQWCIVLISNLRSAIKYQSLSTKRCSRALFKSLKTCVEECGRAEFDVDAVLLSVAGPLSFMRTRTLRSVVSDQRFIEKILDVFCNTKRGKGTGSAVLECALIRAFTVEHAGLQSNLHQQLRMLRSSAATTSPPGGDHRHAHLSVVLSAVFCASRTAFHYLLAHHALLRNASRAGGAHCSASHDLLSLFSCLHNLLGSTADTRPPWPCHVSLKRSVSRLVLVEIAQQFLASPVTDEGDLALRKATPFRMRALSCEAGSGALQHCARACYSAFVGWGLHGSWGVKQDVHNMHPGCLEEAVTLAKRAKEDDVVHQFASRWNELPKIEEESFLTALVVHISGHQNCALGFRALRVMCEARPPSRSAVERAVVFSQHHFTQDCLQGTGSEDRNVLSLLWPLLVLRAVVPDNEAVADTGLYRSFVRCLIECILDTRLLKDLRKTCGETCCLGPWGVFFTVASPYFAFVLEHVGAKYDAACDGIGEALLRHAVRAEDYKHRAALFVTQLGGNCDLKPLLYAVCTSVVSSMRRAEPLFGGFEFYPFVHTLCGVLLELACALLPYRAQSNPRSAPSDEVKLYMGVVDCVGCFVLWESARGSNCCAEEAASIGALCRMYKANEGSAVAGVVCTGVLRSAIASGQRFGVRSFQALRRCTRVLQDEYPLPSGSEDLLEGARR